MIVEEHYAGYRTVGKRSYQQDTYAFCTNEANADSTCLILALADGAGGHQSGEVASDTAARGFLDSYFSNPSAPAAKRMAFALHAANAAVGFAAKTANEDLGTTLTAVRCEPHSISWISVGDSPLYLHRQKTGRLERLNADHSMRGRLELEVASGRMDATEAARQPNRSALLSAISGDTIRLTDQPEKPTKLLPNDIILAASDGIHTLSDEEIFKLIESKREAPARTIAKRLIAAVMEKNTPSQDNATAAIIKITNESSQP